MRPSAIAAAGMVLSQPTSTTSASRQWPVTASSIESAITSREGSEARMPVVPIAMPSVTAMVLNSTGVPPAALMPSRADCASSRSVRLQGEMSDHVCTTPTSGLAMSASDRPVARSMARAGARDGPDLIWSEFTGMRAVSRLRGFFEGPETRNPAPLPVRGFRFGPCCCVLGHVDPAPVRGLIRRTTTTTAISAGTTATSTTSRTAAGRAEAVRAAKVGVLKFMDPTRPRAFPRCQHFVVMWTSFE